MKSSAEYVASVWTLPGTVILMGEHVVDATAYPILRPALTETYRLAQDEDAGGLLCRPSALTGGQVNSFTSIYGSADDLVLAGQRVCLADTDTQSHSAAALGVYLCLRYSLADVLTGKRKAKTCMVKARENLWLLPSA
jgi:aromatic ring hydroxylase